MAQNPPRKVTMTPPRPQLNRENFGQVLTNSRRKISQTKGEIFDNLNDRINIELQQIHDVSMEVYDRLELAQAENKQFLIKIKELEDKLEKYEPKTKLKTPPK